MLKNTSSFIINKLDTHNKGFQKIFILPLQEGLEFPGGRQAVLGFSKTKTFKEMHQA